MMQSCLYATLGLALCILESNALQAQARNAFTAAQAGPGLVFSHPCAAQEGDASTVSGTESPPEWRAFRRAHPYHYQGLSLGGVGADGSRFLSIAEPPPTVCLEDLRRIDPSLADVRRYRWRMGYDGWVGDAGIRLRAMSADSLDALLLAVHRRVYGTTYVMRVDSLSSNGASTNAASLDVKVSAAELRNWLLTKKEGFSRTGGGTGSSLASLIASRSYGEYFSVTPGFVVWLIPVTQDISPYLPAARLWTKDSDLILGAIADRHTIAIIGRERKVPESVLPPLRVETIRTIAGSGTDHLAQSYERNYFFAGRHDTRNDWAPIYLSPVLIDDEYGSLLNITDQMLKSWTEFGRVRYVNFQYPNPTRYPFSAPLNELLRLDELTFNWNTRGAGYILEQDGMRVYALNRTGALPVSYFAGIEQRKTAKTAEAEETAYEYFAGLNDPNLVRVVQYAGLYQLFREFDVQSAVNAIDPPNANNALQGLAQSVARRFADMPKDRLDRYTEGALEYRAEFTAAQALTLGLRNKYGDAGLRALAEMMVQDRRTETMYLGARSALKSDAARAAVPVGRVLHLMMGAESRDSARQIFLAAGERPALSWIRTAAIVESSNSLGGTGGHNLDATVTRIRESSAITPGRVRVIEENGRKVVLANARDVERLSTNVRAIATASENGDAASVSALISKLEVPPIRPRVQAVPPIIRSAELQGGPLELHILGHRNVPRELTAAERTAARYLASTKRPLVEINKLRDGGFDIVIGDPERVIHAANTASAVDAVLYEAPWKAGLTGTHQLQLAGFADDEASIFAENIEWQMRQTTDPTADVVAVSHNGVGDVTDIAVLRTLTKEMDFSTATIGSIRDAGVNAKGERQFIADIELPATAARQALPLPLKIWIAFREGIVMPTIEAIQAAIGRALRPLGIGTTPEVAAAAIKRELRRVGASHVRIGVADFIVVEVPRTANVSVGDASF